MADEQNTAEAGSGGKLAFLENKAILLGVIVVAQAVIAIVLTQFLIVPKMGVQDADMGGSTTVETTEAMPEMGVLVGLEEIIVTLQADPGRKARFLRININLEVRDQLVAEVVSTRLPQLRDLVIMILSEKTGAQLSAPEGKKGLRDEVFRRIDEKMPEGTLMNVYFSDLVVQ